MAIQTSLAWPSGLRRPKSFLHRLSPPLTSILLACVLASAASTGLGQTTPPPLQSVLSARSAAPAASASAPLARLRGTVTAFSGWKNSFFLQDASGGISVDRLENTALQPGAEVEVTGRVKPGLFANIFLSEAVSVLKPGAGLPAPRQAQFNELESGEFDSRFVSVQGTVRAAHVGQMWERSILFLDLTTGQGTITIYVLQFPAGANFDYLVDSQVRVQGVCGTVFNDRRQLTGLRLFTTGLNQLEIAVQSPDPATIPISPLGTLLTLHGPQPDHKIHVRGTVTYQSPGGELYLQEGSNAIHITSPSAPRLIPGTQADAWGFVSSGGYSPEIRDGLLRATSVGVLPPAISIEAGDTIRPENGFVLAKYDGLLVRLNASVVDRLLKLDTLHLTLSASSSALFQAEIGGRPAEWARSLEPGTKIQLTGILVVETDGHRIPTGFHILAQSPTDVVAVQTVFWDKSLLTMLGIDVTVGLGGLLVFVLQRRHDRQDPRTEQTTRSQRLSQALSWSRALTTLALAMASVLFALEISGSSWFRLDQLRVTHGGLLSLPLLALAAMGLLLQSDTQRRLSRSLGVTAGIIVVAAGVGALVAGFAGWQVISPPSHSWLRAFLAEVQTAGRIPPSTDLSMLLLGCVIIWKTSKRFAAAAQTFALVVAFNSLLKLVGVTYGVSALTGLAPQLSTATPCAILFLILSLAVLFGTAQQGFMAALYSSALGGVMLRRVLPVAFLMPLITGYIRLQMQLWGLLDTRFGLTLFALSLAFCFAGTIWISAIVLNSMENVKAAAEDALRERERKLEMIFETGAIGDYSYDVVNDCITAHPAVWRMYGAAQPLASANAGWFLDRQHADDRSVVLAKFAALTVEQPAIDLEFRVIRPDASICWVACRGVATFDSAGKLVQIDGIDLDITEQKRTEASLKESEKMFRELQNAMPQIVWTAGADGTIQHYNARWYAYTGLQPGEPWGDVVPPGQQEILAAKWNEAVVTGSPYENEIQFRRAADDQFRWHLVRAVPVFDEHGNIRNWFGTCTDVHDFKTVSQDITILERRVDQLADADEKFRLLVDSVKDYAIYLLDAEGRIVSWNEGAQRLKLYAAHEVVGRHFSMFYGTDQAAAETARQLLAMAAVEGRCYQESQVFRKDGTRVWAGISISAIYGPSGELRGFSKVIHDLTERRRHDELLINAQKRAEASNVAKSSFLAAMSHEIRTPLNAILGMAELLWSTELQPTQREYVRRFRRAGSNLLSLVNDILDLSKIESGHFVLQSAKFDLSTIVDGAMDLAVPAAAAKNITIEATILPGTPHHLIGDPLRLQQVLNNLLNNAVKFTQQGGISLRVMPHKDRQPGHLQFEVRDTGIGIPADKLDTIFEDFTQVEDSPTRRFGGTGLGLGICRRLLEKMGGAITAKSSPGNGSMFRFDVFLDLDPLAAAHLQPLSTQAIVAAALQPPAAASPAGSEPAAKLRLLIAEDSDDNRFLLDAYLAGQPFEITYAMNGQEAVDAFGPSRFDMILMDVQMPVMDGLTATTRIRQIERQHFARPVPILALSANALVEDTQHSLAAGCDTHLAKPISRQNLLEAIEVHRLGPAAVETSQVRTELKASPPAFEITIPEGFETISRTFIRNQVKGLARIKGLLEAGNIAELKTKGHNMKGTAASYGFPDLTRLGAAIEQAARASDLQKLAEYIDEMERYVVTADDFLCAKQGS